MLWLWRHFIIDAISNTVYLGYAKLTFYVCITVVVSLYSYPLISAVVFPCLLLLDVVGYRLYYMLQAVAFIAEGVMSLSRVQV